ncbi:phage major tail tube protein [Klebsiella pneumoniae]
MALPRKLKHLNIFNAGNSWMGIAESVTLPKFSRKLENYRTKTPEHLQRR